MDDEMIMHITQDDRIELLARSAVTSLSQDAMYYWRVREWLAMKLRRGKEVTRRE
jgi:hypothetical protein